jgi:hypothetical protein
MVLAAVGILAPHTIPDKVTGVTENILKNSGASRI